MRELVRAVMNDDGQIEVIVTPFADAASMDRLAKEISEAVARAFGPDVLREFRKVNKPAPGTH